jgi:hypothetical protein
MGCLVVTDGIKGDQARGAGGDTTTAAAAAAFVDAGQGSNGLAQRPSSICFQVNSGLDCLREKG